MAMEHDHEEVEELRIELASRARELLSYCAESCGVMDCIETLISTIDREELERYLGMNDDELKREADEWVWTCRLTNDSIDACLDNCEDYV